MAHPTVSAVLTDLVSAAVEVAGLGGVLETAEPAGPTRDPRFGDYQSNHAFSLHKHLKLPGSPRDTAEKVRACLPAHPAIAKAEVAGAGFLNFTLDDEWLAGHLSAQAADPAVGVPQSGAGKTLILDYSSPNVAKRMHIGHLGSTIIGSALHRLHQAGGWRVIADNHIGDWGTQFGMLMVAWRRWLDPAALEADPIGELERLYVRFRKETAAPEGGSRTPEQDALVELARAETAKLQAGDPENRALWQRFIALSLQEFEAIYQRLGISFDVVLGESFYNDALPGVLADLQAAGIAVESEGAIVVPFEEGEKGLKGTTLVIRKKDGAALYGTTDLATLEHRRKTWDPDRIIYVVDTRQQLHFRQLFDAWTRWRRARGETDTSRPQLIHTWFGMLKLPEGAVMGNRTGNVIRLVDLLDEAQRRARVVMEEATKGADLTDEEKTIVSESVGVGAVRYFMLAQNPQTDVGFDWDRALALQGNSAPFLMISYARCRSIQRKGGIAQPSLSGLRLGHPSERSLAMILLRFPLAVEAALETQRPNLVSDSLYEIAAAFNRFFHDCPVLLAPDDATRQSRLAIVEATARTLEKGLGLLGIPALAKM